MRGAYTVLGIAFLILITGAALLFSKNAEAPVQGGIGDGEEVTKPASQPEIPMSDSETTLTLTSEVFEDGGTIPVRFTCDGENVNPPLKISGVPEGTESLALLVDDPDIPDAVKESRGIEVFDHWVVYNLDPFRTEIEMDIVFQDGQDLLERMGSNSRGDQKYTGPCPPREFEPTEHRYLFKLYALDNVLALGEGASKADVEAAIEGHVISESVLMGRYERPAEQREQ